MESHMRTLIFGCSLLALAAPTVQAQTSTAPASTTMTQPGEVAPGSYLVFFGFDEAALSSEARSVVAEAARSYRSTGTAQVTVTGHTDTSGSAEYNQALSERRAAAVAAELVRQGVPADSIVTVGRGENDLLVPTGDGVREPQNRRVEIVVPQPAAEPAPVAAAPVEPAVPPAPPEPEEPGRFTFTVGGLYGHNFGETDGSDGGDKTENDLAGLQLTFDALPAFLGGLSLKQAILGSFNGVDDGLNGRTVASLNLMPLNLVVFRPFLSANFGGVYGEGVQDGLVAGPELGFDIAPFGGVTLRTSVAYDYQFRNAGWDEGILWGGVGLGYRF
jgi:hypothetical protein